MQIPSPRCPTAVLDVGPSADREQRLRLLHLISFAVVLVSKIDQTPSEPAPVRWTSREMLIYLRSRSFPTGRLQQGRKRWCQDAWKV
jgi:hypothetical protein